MMKLNKAQKIYTASMAGLFVALDLAGVSHGDKLALSLLIGAVAPLFLPRFASQLVRLS
jgi:hypothetical protein